MKKFLSAAIAIAVLSLLPATTFAFHFRDVEVKVRGGVSETYDDNITYVKDDKIDDFYTKPFVGGSILYEGKTTTLYASGNYYHEFYADNPDFDNNSGDATATLNSELSKYDRIMVTDAFSRTYEPRSFQDQFGFIGGRYNSTRNRVDASYARDVSKNFGFSLRYSNEYNSYSRSDISKSYLNGAGIEGAYTVSSDLTFISGYDFAIRNFDPGSNARVNTLRAGVRKYFTRQLYCDAQTGVDFINSFSDKDYTKPFVNLSLTDDIDERTSATFFFLKRHNTISYVEDIFDEWLVSGMLKHEFSRKLSGNVSIFYGEGEYIDFDQEDHFLGTGGALRYDINDNWRADLSYSYSHQTSTFFFNQYRKNTVSLGLTAEF